MGALLDRLAENRIPILLAEIGAYIHLIGRFSEEFVIANAKDSTEIERKFMYQKVCDSSNSSFFEGTGLDTILKDHNWESLINDFRNLSNAGELSSNRVTLG